MRARRARRWDEGHLCASCQAWVALHERPPDHRRPGRELLASVLLLTSAVLTWRHHNDVGAIAAVALMLGCVGWIWQLWARGCPGCWRVRRGQAREDA
jgi:hypothetical protein